MKKASVAGVLAGVMWMMTTTTTVAQDYSSTNNGAWTSGSNWTNASGWGSATPPIDGTHGSGTITMNHNMTVTANYFSGSPVLNIKANRTLTITGDFSLTGNDDEAPGAGRKSGSSFF